MTCWLSGVKIGSISELRNDGSFFPVTVLDGNPNRAQSRGAKSKRIPKSHLLQHLGDARRNRNTRLTQTYTCKRGSTCRLRTHKHTHTLSSQEEGGLGLVGLQKAPAASARLVTFKGSCCINQVRPVQARGSVWEGHEARVAVFGPVRQGAVREPKLICRDRQAL